MPAGRSGASNPSSWSTYLTPDSGRAGVDGAVSASYRWSTDFAAFHPGGATIGGTTVKLSTLQAIDAEPRLGYYVILASLAGAPAGAALASAAGRLSETRMEKLKTRRCSRPAATRKVSTI
mgnify:CR=1 FL=1